MPRCSRLEVSGGFYHVMNRGAARRHIFVTDELKQVFLLILEEVCEKYRFVVHGYCIMGNHYHLLIQTLDANLSAGMRYLNSRYAMEFNRRRRKDGPIFRCRFKSIFISDSGYLLNVSRYIHLNPVEAGIVSAPELYPWSNYGMFIGASPESRWCKPLPSVVDAITYRAFVNEGNSLRIRDFYSKAYLKRKL